MLAERLFNWLSGWVWPVTSSGIRAELAGLVLAQVCIGQSASPELAGQKEPFYALLTHLVSGVLHFVLKSKVQIDL